MCLRGGGLKQVLWRAEVTAEGGRGTPSGCRAEICGGAPPAAAPAQILPLQPEIEAAGANIILFYYKIKAYIWPL